MLSRNEMKTARVMVPTSGGDLAGYDAVGELLWSIGLAGGVQSLDQYAQYVPEGGAVDVSQGLTVMQTAGTRAKRMSFGPHAFDTGANPDFKPTSYTAAEVRTRKLLEEVRSSTKALERRQKAFARMAEQVDPPVIGGGDTAPVEVASEPEAGGAPSETE